jgi:ABC-2 type transport system ATP-binding protein
LEKRHFEGDMSQPILTVDRLVKRYGDFTAVNGIQFSVNEREVFGFLGPNGAGKSTTIKMICTLLKPTEGTITVAGHDTRKSPADVRATIGIVFQDTSLDSTLTAQENLDFHCLIYHIPRDQRAKRIQRVLDLMELGEARHRIVKTFSGGMRRRLEIARGLLHEPRLLILDEPTVGLDPQTRHYIWEYVRELRKQHDTTVFMTTHYMDEAEYCDRCAIIDKGQLIALDTPATLKRGIAVDQIELETSQSQAAAAVIKEHFGLEVTVTDRGVEISVQEADREVPRLLSLLSGSQIPVESLRIHRPTLEDVFIHLTGRKIREEEGTKEQRKLDLRRMKRL